MLHAQVNPGGAAIRTLNRLAHQNTSHVMVIVLETILSDISYLTYFLNSLLNQFDGFFGAGSGQEAITLCVVT